MSDIVLVQVPRELADDLVSAGFDEVEPVRGGGLEAQMILALVSTVVTLAADVATILVAKDAIEDFFRRVRSWMARRTGPDPGSEFVIEVSSRSAGATSRLRLVSRRAEAAAAPQVDMAALASLLHSVVAAGGASEEQDPGPSEQR